MQEIIEAQMRKNAGQDRSSEQTNTAWKMAVLEIIREVAKTHRFFIVDEVRELANERGLGNPEKYGAWGSLFRQAAREKVIKKTNRFKISKIKTNNMGVRQVWRSLIFEHPSQESLEPSEGIGGNAMDLVKDADQIH